VAPIPSPQILAREGNKQLVRYTTADALWLELIVNKEDGSGSRAVIHIHVPSRLIEHYIVRWESNGETSKELLDEKTVTKMKLREILGRALRVRTFEDFVNLAVFIREA
jgi:hypothetical protein